jgi:hypothetical protein
MWSLNVETIQNYESIYISTLKNLLKKKYLLSFE